MRKLSWDWSYVLRFANDCKAMVVWRAFALAILPFQALLPGLVARKILEVRCPRETLEAFAQRLESYVFTLDEPTLRMRMQVRARNSLTCLRYASLIFPRRLVSLSRLRLQVRVTGILDCVRQWSLILVKSHLVVLMWLHVHVSLRCSVFLRLLPHLHLLLRLLLLLHMRSTPMHVAVKSWSDTGRVQGPTGRRSTKGGGSCPAEDLRPVSEVEAGVKFRPIGAVRRQVAGSLPRR